MPKAKPKYAPLRQDDDFSYLEGPPESREGDFFDPIKNIKLGDFRLTLGGEFRFRLEADDNRFFGSREPAQDTFTLYRGFWTLDLKYKKLARFFYQGIAAFQGDLEPFRNFENRWDIYQLFFDVRFLGEKIPLTLRAGRQALLFGRARVIGPLDWANTPRSFDAVDVFWRSEDWSVDVVYAKPVPVEPKGRDNWDEDTDLYIGYVTYKGIPRHGVDFYFIGMDRTADTTNANGRTGDLSLFTLGGRFWGKTGGFDYETELSGQWGRWAGETVQAWAWDLDFGYTFEQAPWTPRLGSGFTFATGDSDPNDHKHQTFNQLFPTGHIHWGYLDVVGRQNAITPNVNLSVVPIKNVKVSLAYFAFWVHEREDALYNAGGASTRRDVTGQAGREIGHEVDLLVNWQIDTHSNLHLGYGHFWDSDFIIETGPSEDFDWYYLMYTFKF